MSASIIIPIRCDCLAAIAYGRHVIGLDELFSSPCPRLADPKCAKGHCAEHCRAFCKGRCIAAHKARHVATVEMRSDGTVDELNNK